MKPKTSQQAIEEALADAWNKSVPPSLKGGKKRKSRKLKKSKKTKSKRRVRRRKRTKRRKH